MHRIPKFAQLIGSGGKHVAFCQDVVEAHVVEICKLRAESTASSATTDYELTIIDDEFMAKYPVEVGTFSHVHFTCDDSSDAGMVLKLKRLSLYLNGSFENRFQKLVDDPGSLRVIQGQIPHLVRPDHWKSVVSWAVNFVAKAAGRAWSDLAAHEKYEIMVFAMLTGRSTGAIHLDMQQATNLVDFMADANNTEALRAMMDDRSDPEKYQVSRVAALLQDKKVTSLCTVTSVWGMEGESHKSDLDLHTKLDGQELYYGNLKVGKCSLDFDANASKVEENSAENISLNQVGSFAFRVNNFNNRDGVDVPFQVIVRKPGVNEVYSGVWPRTRAKDDFLHVCTVHVTAEDLEEKPLELSEVEQRKLAAKESEWAAVFGDPTSVVAIDDDVAVSLVCQSAQDMFSPPSRSAQETFSQLLLPKAKAAQSTKPTLADRCQLESLPGLIEYVIANECSLEVHTRSFVPAYVTRIETSTDVLGSKFPINAYHRKNELPQQPRLDEQSAVRFDESWGASSTAVVHGFAQIHNVCFMVLKGVHLPKDQSWPLGGGMYPTILKPEVHHHRSKWASFHFLVTPTMPERGVPLVGSALVGLPSFQFILNGREISVRAQ